MGLIVIYGFFYWFFSLKIAHIFTKDEKIIKWMLVIMKIHAIALPVDVLQPLIETCLRTLGKANMLVKI